jgi:predicted Rossmann-fold nucleotide-binding protein
MPGDRLRVCVFASSRTTTPQKYLNVAKELGAALAEGGHLCINGGGKAGCMGALNEACFKNNGRIRSVIHHKWVVDKVEFKDAHELVSRPKR